MLGQHEWTRVQIAPVQAQASFAVNKKNDSHPDMKTECECKSKEKI